MIARILLPLFLLSPALTSAEPIRKSNPPSVARPLGPYSHMAVVPPGSRLLFLAGQVGNRPDGTIHAGFEDQFIQAYDNVLKLLAAEQAGPEHLVKVTIFAAARPTEPARIRDYRANLFKGIDPPPSTWINVPSFPNPALLVEIEAIAAVPPR